VTQLRERDSRAIFDFLAEAGAVEGPEPFPAPLVESLRRLIGCDAAEFDEMDRSERRCGSTQAVLGVREPVEGLPSFWEIRHDHPLCRLHDDEPDFHSAIKLSDLFTPRQLRSTEIYAEWFGPQDVSDELEVTLSPSRRFTRTVVFDREVGSFGEREREILDLLRPHLVSLRKRAIERRRLDAALMAAASSVTAVIAFNCDGHVDLATPDAERLHLAHLGQPLGEALSPALWNWIESKPREPLCIQSEQGGLVIELDQPATLLLREQGLDSNVEALTNREREVLGLVARGKRNAEIAAELWVTESTVRKHLEHVFEKVGARNRTEAAALLARRIPKADDGTRTHDLLHGN
jgi:DNA-binding CsgD family transcriptional regulator